MTAARVDLIIPSYNGAAHLATCLPALRRQRYQDFRLIVVDNGSSDDTATIIERVTPEARLFRLPRNVGFAAAVNAGLRLGDSEFVALLNNDTEPEPGWLAALVTAMDAEPTAGAVASKIRLFDQRDHLHSAGDTYSTCGTAGSRGVWQRDDGRFDAERRVFGACAGAALYRREALEAAARVDGAVFDPDFFAYCEDVDLNWRLRLLGYEIVYAPDAVVYHRLSATGGGPLASYRVARNSLAVIVKDVPGPLLRRYWPQMLAARLVEAAMTLSHAREPAARARLRGLLTAIAVVPAMLPKRRRIQAARRVPVGALPPLLAPCNWPWLSRRGR